MPQLRQFDLQLAFEGTGALRKDIEDQAGTGKHATGKQPFQVSFLGWAECVIEDNQVSMPVLHGRKDFFRLAPADKQSRVW